MNLISSLSVRPIAAWLILSGAIATQFPIKLEIIQIILLTTALLSIAWLPGRRWRSAPFLLLYITTAILALTIRLPLPTSWHPLAILLLTLSTWTIILIIPLGTLIYFLLSTARTDHPNQHSG